MADEEAEEKVATPELDELIARDAFGVRTYRCNAPPVQPFDDSDVAEHKVLAEVFA